VKIPREFVFMDRAAIGLGGVFLHLKAELNFYQLFQKEIENFDPVTLVEKQTKAMTDAGLEPIGAEDHGLDGVPSAVAAQ
jgi:hypothetical protein